MMTELQMKKYDIMVDNWLATEEELALVQSVIGNWDDAMNHIVQYRFGYETLEDYLEEIKISID